ncbi:multidrug ABC transporter ATPase [Frigoribacterium sp. 2-23]|uniref:multidrug ABC transporter ATPase n=1 Tax=Frigoribacterium sp. 2-23 TaxID=3415006 RepID=UPI003C6FB1DB
MAKNNEKIEPAGLHRTERVLVFMIAAIVILSIAAFAATLIGTASGITNFGTGIWPAVVVLPLIGLPLAVVMIIVFVVMSAIRRSRETRGTTR